MALLPAISAILVLSVLGGADLEKIDRSIRREPVFQSKDPQFCLLVFGAEANLRVWLVLDGETLYVDRNANCDLTEPGERFEPSRVLHRPERQDWTIEREFMLVRPFEDGQPQGDPVLPGIPDSTDLWVEHFIPAEVAGLPVERIRQRPFRVLFSTMRSGEDVSLAFAARPSEAPIVHFDGPKQLALSPLSQPLRRGETTWLAVQLRTPGLGASTRTYMAEGMEETHPVAEIEFPPRWPSDEPARTRLELPGRG